MKILAKQSTFKLLVTIIYLGLIFLSCTMQAQDSKLTDAAYKSGDYLIPQKSEDISPLLYGEKIPDAVLPDASGKSTDLNKAVAKRPTVLVFYRGGWCPYCSRQLSALQEVMPELEKMGYQLIAISTDSPERLQESATKEELSYMLLSDADLSLSKKVGIAFKAPKRAWDLLQKTTDGKDVDSLLPVPSVFILNQKGVIHFEYINPDYTKRLSPDLLRAVANSLIKEI